MNWIPVTEQLPDTGDVLACYLDPQAGRYIKVVWSGSVRQHPEYFSHWLPLPEMPK